jgi:hypothetical protein
VRPAWTVAETSLTTASRLTGRATTCADLLRDEVLLGHALVAEDAPTLGTRTRHGGSARVRPGDLAVGANRTARPLLVAGRRD